MIDLKLIINNPEIVIKDLEKRDEKELIPKVEEIRELYANKIKLQKKLDELRHKRNVFAKNIAEAKKQKQDISEQIKEMKQISEQIKAIEQEIEQLDERIKNLLLIIPNITHESVPIGKDDSENVEVRKWSSPKEFGFKPKDHIEIFESKNWFDLERAAKVAGARFYYLKGSAVKLEFALINYALDFIASKGFEIMTVPMLAKPFAFYGTGFLPLGKDDIYKIENEELYLIGTAEVSLGAYHANETLLEEELPKRYAGISTSFRTEAGSHGRDTKGIFRVHQFEKVELFSYAHPDRSWDEHEYLISIVEEFYQSLGIPYRIMNICTGDLGWVAAKKYDLEAWLPGQGKYRELVSCSNTTDYQARRLNIKYREKEGSKPKGYVHTLNSTLTAIQRTLVAITENYQLENGNIEVPKPLRPYLGNVKEL